jgi:hypothetical protein
VSPLLGGGAEFTGSNNLAITAASCVWAAFKTLTCCTDETFVDTDAPADIPIKKPPFFFAINLFSFPQIRISVWR